MAEGDEQLADLQLPQGSSEVEVRVGFAVLPAILADVGIMEEAGVRLEDALDEERVVGVDGPTEAERGLNPGEVMSQRRDLGGGMEGSDGLHGV